MTLVLTIDWSHASTAVTIVDIAARTTVAERVVCYAACARVGIDVNAANDDDIDNDDDYDDKDDNDDDNDDEL